MTDLTRRKCKPCEGGVAPYTAKQAEELLRELRGWVIENGRLVKVYPFRNYYETMAFVNALAWISHREDHHPDLTVRYNQCRVEYWTHAIEGLSENDFICAAKCDALSDLQHCMQRVYSSFNLQAAHHAKNVLQNEGIRATVRNEHLASAMGELPPAECQFEVWVLRDDDGPRAEALLRQGPPARGAAWHCARCGEVSEPQFTQCWKCGAVD